MLIQIKDFVLQERTILSLKPLPILSHSSTASIHPLLRNLSQVEAGTWQWNQNKEPVLNSHTYRHLVFDKESENFGKRKASSTNGSGLTG